MRRSSPWGLSDYWLRPSKVITDPIHADVYVTKLEKELIDTSAFQRLRRVRQLGTTHWVYPGATHTRFAHSLGTLRAVQDLFDVAYGQRFGHHAVPDLFGQWERDLVGGKLNANSKPSGTKGRTEYLRRVAEAMVLARLGALLHDICHVPFGHSLEDDLGILQPHDENAWRFDRIWEEISRSLKRQVGRKRFGQLATLMPNGDLYQELRPLILASEEFEGPDGQREPIDATRRLKFPFVADMVGNTICADLIDYLHRDHSFLGLPLSLGSRFMSAFYVTPESPGPLPDRKGPLYQERMAVLIHRDGRPRADVVTELLKHLRYRYELQERALVHHAKLAADAMLGRLLDLWTPTAGATADASAEDSSPSGSRDRRVKIEVSLADGSTWTNTAKPPTPEARNIEDILRDSGDEGFLERLAAVDPERFPSVATLANDLINRRLFKPLARAAGAHASEDLHAQFGDRATRRALEQEAARYARLDHDWHLILWLPPPTMRLKLAEMLVDHGKGIAKFVDYSEQGSEIYRAHKALWAVAVYAHPSLEEDQKRAALARLAELMGVCWGRYLDKLGDEPAQWPNRLATLQVFGAEKIDGEVEEFLRDVDLSQVMSRSHEELDYVGVRSQLRAIARKRGYTIPSQS